ncbi:MAG: 50S ribosomal protein L17 [candidate division Zixibacteria bacterium]|jgi:large subunit ribosomal protein L17|nr:50S ribosomal protein L17 [candidate division Zixibacteria bacterium]
MGHQDKVKKLGRTKPHREAMLANMAMSLFTHRVIKTTDAKAKALRPVVDRIITLAKKDTLASKRQVARTIHVKEVFKKLYTDILPNLADRNSGYTRVVKLGVRRGDGAPVSVVELLTPAPVVTEDKKDKKAKKQASAAAKTPS